MSWRLNSPRYLRANYPLNNNALDLIGGNDGTWAGATEAYRDNAYGKKMGDFNGTTSLVTVTNNSIVQDLFNGGAAISCLVNADSDGEGNSGRFCQKNNEFFMYVASEAAEKMEVGFYHYFSGAGGQWSTTATELVVGTPTLVVLTYDSSAVGNDPIIYVNDKLTALTEDVTPSGTADNDTTDLIIGNRADVAKTFDGGIGSMRIYKNMIMTWDEAIALRRMETQ